MKKKLTRVEGVIGFVPDYCSIIEDVRLDDLKYWGRQKVEPLKYTYRPLKPHKFKLTEAVKATWHSVVHEAKAFKNI
jgi:hypothetical protein